MNAVAEERMSIAFTPHFDVTFRGNKKSSNIIEKTESIVKLSDTTCW